MFITFMLGWLKSIVMPGSVQITTPFPSPESVAKLLGIPPRRAKQIAKLVATGSQLETPEPIRIALKKATRRARQKAKDHR